LTDAPISIIHHRCPVVTRDLEIIQQALSVTNVSNEKELNLIQGKDADVPFASYLTKKQKKQLNKFNSYNTRSKDGPKGGWASPFYSWSFFFYLFLFFSFSFP